MDSLLYRFIFRVDFDHRYELADRPGTIIETILDTANDYWDVVGPTNNAFQINAAKNVAANRSRAGANFAVDTNAVSGSIEIEEGVEFEKFLSSEYLEVCNASLEELISKFGVKNLNRVGIRLLMTGGRAKDFDHHRDKVTARYKDLAVPPDASSGFEVSDVALILTGKLEHDIQFRLQTGPGGENDIGQFLQKKVERVKEATDAHEFAADIDIFQHNINFRGTNLLRWIRAKDPYARKLLSVAKYSSRG
ncbi:MULTISPECIES: hypothetical protein [Sinorhizobium]|uniref:TIGR04255 family protein n=2 Tax=Sinorhizobium TaxID=28105 RepID=A0A6N7LM19_SINTE|nr:MULTISPECIES: hypothetical protein [Sinorhizobium]MBB4189186.1 hypothetical protein [Sinorhizobium terangae]MCZ4093495.1 hypothetical protein [Sinorhizobium psoraleae]MQX18258.1 hypothetical protein [Sinorhizobium terangae]